MEEKDISTEEVKQLLTNFFKEEGYYLIRENYAAINTENYISLLFETGNRDGVDIRILNYLPHIPKWTLSDSDAYDGSVAKF
ncbi:hypothetical protein BB06_02790 [Pediococcus pentosaceus CGMCC 7049]|uniref:Uncharacterized protein n=1 Tax=Pediococcus pentosaceus CGMCC 7049 TaxID=1460385 RepID=A0AAU7NP18_PEDPE|nr:hypothetical protein [Pediococcus pentosaceus]WPK17551.1 hypothetical protein R6U75_09825 [Pediococcus pentosaceus]WPK17558.1 hypothetical protein R6U75_09445 [Pediococcus pentosaceus]